MNEFIVYPMGLTFQVWGNFLINSFPESQIPIPPDETEWWGWAQYLSMLPTFLTAPVADKNQYPKPESWQDWALIFIQMLGL